MKKAFLVYACSAALILLAAAHGHKAHMAATNDRSYTASALGGYTQTFNDLLVKNARQNTATFSPLPSLPGKPALKGVHISWDEDEIQEFEEKLDTTVQLVATEVHWGNNKTFPDFLKEEVATKDKTLVLFWNPMDYNKPILEQEKFSYEHILAGTWDEYILSFAKEAERYPGKVIIAPFEEVNGYWTPWSGTGPYGSSELYIEAYRYLRGFFNKSHISFAWVVNHISLPEAASNTISSYYPGDQYVDVIGINGFNFGDPWLSFDEIFTSAVKQVSAYEKPIYVFSTASAEGNLKPEWVRSFLTSRLLRSGTVGGWIWFNESKEKDWPAWSSDETLEAFREGL